MNKIVYQSNLEGIRSVGGRLDGVKMACSARSLELRDEK